MAESKRKQKYIPVSNLRLESAKDSNTDKLADLADSIRKYGILAPLIVAGPDEKNMYTVLDGAERYKAVVMINASVAKTKAIKKVPCHVVDDGTDKPRILCIKEQLQYVAVKDSEKRKANRIEIVEMLCGRCESGEIEAADLVKFLQKYLGLNTRYARMYRAIFTTGISELREAVKCSNTVVQQRHQLEEGEKTFAVHISVHHASRIATHSPEEQKNIIDRVNAGEKVEDVLKEFSERA